MNEIVKTVSSSTYMNGNRYTLSTDKDTTTKTIEYVVYYWDNDKESKGLDTVNFLLKDGNWIVESIFTHDRKYFSYH